MRKVFIKSFINIFDGATMILKGLFNIIGLTITFPAIILERRYGLVTFIRLRFKLYAKWTTKTSFYHIMMIRHDKAIGNKVPDIFKHHSEKSLRIIAYYTYKSYINNKNTKL